MKKESEKTIKMLTDEKEKMKKDKDESFKKLTDENEILRKENQAASEKNKRLTVELSQKKSIQFSISLSTLSPDNIPNLKKVQSTVKIFCVLTSGQNKVKK